MKKFKFLALILAAVFAVTTFASCSDDDDDDGDPSAVTTWVCELNEEGESETDTVYFYDDGSFKMDVKISFGGENMDFTAGVGTYTGDSTKAGTVKVHVTQRVDDDDESEDLKLKPVSEDYDFVISADGKTATFDGDTYTKK